MIKGVRTKPLKVIFDPAVTYTEQMGTRYFAVTADLHAMQRRASAVANALGALYPQMTDIASKIDARTDVPAASLGPRPSVLQSMGRESRFTPGSRLTGLGH